MFKRPHHQLIERLLNAFDAEILIATQCFFGGGTAISLLLDEYRESVGVDFLCSSQEGYRRLRNIVKQGRLGALLKEPVEHLRDVRADQYGLRTFLSIDGTPIKVEIVREARIHLEGVLDPLFPVPCLARDDLFAEKLLANADCALDRDVLSRDIIDIGMMVRHWGAIPDAALRKAHDAYGASVDEQFEAALRLITEDKAYFGKCLNTLSIDRALSAEIVGTLAAQLDLMTRRGKGLAATSL